MVKTLSVKIKSVIIKEITKNNLEELKTQQTTNTGHCWVSFYFQSTDSHSKKISIN